MQTTMYVVLLSAFKVLLFRYTDQEDQLVGSPFSNRDKVSLGKLVGFFNETLVLRFRAETGNAISTINSTSKKNNAGGASP